jgi:hypothetical protein
MRTDHLQKFIDRKIEDIINEKKPLGEIYLELDRRIAVAKRSSMRSAFVEYVEFFCNKRKDDFREMYNNYKFSSFPTAKIFKLIKLRDRLTDCQIIEQI